MKNEETYMDENARADLITPTLENLKNVPFKITS